MNKHYLLNISENRYRPCIIKYLMHPSTRYGDMSLSRLIIVL